MPNNAIPIVIPTRGRAKLGTTWNLFPEAILFMHHEEKRTYRDAGIENKIITHDCLTSSTARNFILDYYGKDKNIIMMDDDIKSVGRFGLRNGKTAPIALTGNEFYHHLVNGFDLCHKGKTEARLFGVAPTSNPLNFTDPVKMAMFVNGPCMGIITSKLRFDEECMNKNDYDFTLQHLKTGYLTFRLDYLWQKNDYNKMDGGSRYYRTKKREEKTYYYLLGKWPGYLIPNPKRGLEFILRVKKSRKKA
jgi:hypothetical protein